MKRAAAAAVAFLTVLVLALWQVPPRLDWEAQRGRLAALAAAQIGRSVAFNGELRVALLPRPVVEAADVVVGGGAEGLAVSARALRLRLGLAPLLLGRLEPREVVLIGADIRLPWPPPRGATLRPPPWLTALDARIEDGRIHLADTVLENVEAELTARGPLDAVQALGRFAWRGTPVRFQATVGRPGYDGVGTLDLALSAHGATAGLRGFLVAEGGFEGRLEASGPDLAAFFSVPPGAFRASGRLAITADLLALDDLSLDLAGVPASGAASLRLAPVPRLDMALSLARMDLAAWIAVMRAAPPPALPTSLDLSAEAAVWRGTTIRRLRGGLFRDGERMTLTDVSALLPGEMEIEATGATARQRLELALRFRGDSLRATLAAFGVRLEGTDPARLRSTEGRARLVLEESQLGVPELAATLDGARLSGAGVLRFGARPALGLGLTFDRLELDGLLALPGWPEAAGWFSGLDANLRLAAETARWHGVAVERAALDAALENGRIGVRRLSGRIGGADLSLAGNLTLAPAPRFADLAIEVAAGNLAGLAALAPGVAAPAGLLAMPLALRIGGGGPAEALALRAEGDLGELRLETQGILDLGQGRLAGSVTLRHPGAVRLAAEVTGAAPPEWLGEGSFSLVANVAVSGGGLVAEHAELVAGGLRARGQVTLGGGERWQLGGRIAAERLPLPEIAWRSDRPLGLPALGGMDAELALQAAAMEMPGLPVLEGAEARLVLAAGRLGLQGLKGRLGGGSLEGTLEMDGTAQPPRLAASFGLDGAAVAGPLLGLPLDLTAGRVRLQGRVAAAGHAPAALLATLSGEGALAVQDGVLAGFDLGALARAATLPELGAAEAGLRQALEGGATAFERLEAGWRAADGRFGLETARIVGEGIEARIEGGLDLARDSLELRLLARPGPAEAPEIGLRLTGPPEAPRRQPEIAPWARWRAEQG